MRAILIDPVAKTVTDVETSGKLESIDGLPGIYELLKVEIIPAVTLPVESHVETLFLDDEGLLKPNHFFRMYGYVQPFAGRGLVLGTDGEGDSVSTDFITEGFARLVTFEGGPEAEDRSHLAKFEIVSFNSTEELIRHANDGIAEESGH